jgi:small subunit ribosomal protein S20
MPNIKSAMKRVRTSGAVRIKNAAVKARIKSIRRAFFEAVDKKEKEQSVKLFQQYCSVLDKSAKKGIIKKNTATRRKSRASAKLRTI